MDGRRALRGEPFALFETNGAAYFTSVHDVFAPNDIELPLVIAETSWPGASPLPNAKENQRADYDWILGPENEFTMVYELSRSWNLALVAHGKPAVISASCRWARCRVRVSVCARGPRSTRSMRTSTVPLATRTVTAISTAQTTAPSCPTQTKRTATATASVTFATTANRFRLESVRRKYRRLRQRLRRRFNGDGVKTQADLDILNARIAEFPSGGCTNPAYNNQALDLNGDFVVDSADVTAYNGRPASVVNLSGWACAGSTACPRVECAANPLDICAP